MTLEDIENEINTYEGGAVKLLEKLLAVAKAALKVTGKKSNPQFIPQHLNDLRAALEELEQE